MGEYKCKIKASAVVDWVKRGEQDGNCPPCLMNPLAGNYLGILEDAGLTRQKDKLQKAWDSGQLENIAQALDEIKREVSPEISKQLEDCDCMAQEFKNEE